MSDTLTTPDPALSVHEDIAALLRKHGKGSRELANLATDAAGLPQGVAEGSRKRNQRILLQMLADHSDGESGEEEAPGDQIRLTSDAAGEPAADAGEVVASKPVPSKPKGRSVAKSPPADVPKPSVGFPPGAFDELTSVLLQMNTKMDSLASRVVELHSDLRVTQADLVDLRDRKPPVPVAAQARAAPGRREVAPFARDHASLHLDDAADSESDPEVLEARQLLRVSLQKKAARASVHGGKSTVRTDGLAGVESMEAMMVAPGGVPTSLEHTLVHKLTVFMNDSPALYAKVPPFARTDLRTFARNYDRIRAELLALRQPILSSSALEAAAQDVQLRFLDVFVPNKSLVKAMKSVVRPEEDHIFQLMGGSPERLTLMHSRAKQASFLHGFGGGRPGKEEDGPGADPAPPAKDKKK